jgi:hypothetical protein
VRCGIHSNRRPRGAAAGHFALAPGMCVRLFACREGIEGPEMTSGQCIEGVDMRSGCIIATRLPDEYLVVERRRSSAYKIPVAAVRYPFIPQQLASFGIKRDEMAIQRAAKDHPAV